MHNKNGSVTGCFITLSPLSWRERGKVTWTTHGGKAIYHAIPLHQIKYTSQCNNTHFLFKGHSLCVLFHCVPDSPTAWTAVWCCRRSATSGCGAKRCRRWWWLCCCSPRLRSPRHACCAVDGTRDLSKPQHAGFFAVLFRRVTCIPASLT